MISRLKVSIFLLCVGVCVVYREHVTETFSQLLDTSPCACGTCLSEDDVWFMQTFSKSVEPFLSRKHNLTEAVFNWWKTLQAEKRNFDFYNATVDKLFQTFPPTPDVVEGSPDRCRTCAVVGNSANLKRSHYGPLIDYHDIIIRMNRGRTKGYEADVGSRTTHHVMYPESAVDLDNNTHLVLVPFKILDLEWLIKALTTGFTGASYMPVKSKIKANKDLVMVVSPAFMRFVHNKWLKNKGKYPSTGFMALVLALHICDKVSVFGFGADTDGNWSHYWEKLRNLNLKTGIHPGSHEYEILKQLAVDSKVEFYTGW